MKRILLSVGLITVAVLAVAAWLLPTWLAQGSEQVAREVEGRLSEALGADCQVGTAKVLSTREADIEAVGCLFQDGPLVGFGAGRAAVHFTRAPLSGHLPPIEHLVVNDVTLRLRELPDLVELSRAGGAELSFESPEPGTKDLDTNDPDANEADAAHTLVDPPLELEREVLRFFNFSEALDQGEGGQNVPALLERLAPHGQVRVDRASVQDSSGQDLLADIHARIDRADNTLSVAVAAELGTGGLAALDGTLSSSGLQGARFRLEGLPVADLLTKAAGEALEVQDGVVSGDLTYTASADLGSWAVDLGFNQLVVHNKAIGNDWIPLPEIRLVGKLVPDRRSGILTLEDGHWRVTRATGDLTGSLGPVGTEALPQIALRMHAETLRLGQLLGALPEELMPSAWAEEIQGTMQLDVRFDGPLRKRREWALDWETDFSQLMLASGSLAEQVERLEGPFQHLFPPGPEGKALIRSIGPDGSSFVPLEEISPHLINAVVSTEDSGFFIHSGFEEESIKEAMLENLREGEGRGGSTITQQLAKNLFLSGERTFARKLKEAVISWRLESDLPKERLLEIYLNIAEWGPGLYGASDAAEHYFGRTPARLRPEQAAFLASLLPSPRRFHGYYHGKGLTRNRFKMVQDILFSMYQSGRLRPDTYHLARGAPIEMASCGF